MAPARLVPLSRHWKLSGLIPFATTAYETSSDTATVRLCGWEVMVGDWHLPSGPAR